MALRFDEGAYFNAYQSGQENRKREKFDPTIVEALGKITTGLMSPKLEMKKAMVERQKEAPDLLIKLRENNVPAPEANQAVANYVRTGSFEVPSHAVMQKLEPLPQGVEGPQQQITTRELIPFGKDKRDTEASIALKEAQTEWWKRRPATSGSKGDPREVTTSNLSGIVNALSKRLESEIPGSEGYNEALAEIQPYMDELNARLKRSSVQPGGIKTPEPTPSAPVPVSQTPPKKGLIDRALGVFTSKANAAEPKTSESRSYMEGNSELNGVVRDEIDEMDEPVSGKQQDIEQARQAVSKGLVSREEALKRLQRKYGPGVKF